MKCNSIWESEEADLGGKWRGYLGTTLSSGSRKAKEATLSIKHVFYYKMKH